MGMLNAVGLQNKGVDYFAENIQFFARLRIITAHTIPPRQFIFTLTVDSSVE